MKSLLIDELGMDISFAYSQEINKSQIVIPKSLKPKNVFDHVVLCAEEIKQECKSYDFKLGGSYKDSRDCKLSMDHFKVLFVKHYLKDINSAANRTLRVI